MASRERKIHQYVREKHGEQVVIPSSETLRLVWREWFGPGGSRQRYARSAAVAEANATGGHVVIHRPGQVVALDTTPLPVLVRETVFSGRSRRTSASRWTATPTRWSRSGSRWSRKSRSTRR